MRAGVRDLFREVEMPLLPVLAGMELAGVTIDRDQLAAMSVEFARTLADLEDADLRARRPPVQHRVTQAAGADPLSRAGPAGNEAHADRLLDGCIGPGGAAAQHEAVGLILEHRQVSKLKGTYVDALPGLVGRDGRLHTTYQQAVAATGRLSSIDPNLQNIPIRSPLGRRIRRAFVAPPAGCCSPPITPSRSCASWLHVSGDAGLKADFAAHSDIHLAAAARVLGVEADDVRPTTAAWPR